MMAVIVRIHLWKSLFSNTTRLNTSTVNKSELTLSCIHLASSSQYGANYYLYPMFLAIIAQVPYELQLLITLDQIS